jgi:hypothetical protein
MSLSEEAAKKATADQSAAQKSQAERELAKAVAVADDLKARTGFDVTFQPAVEVASSKSAGRNEWGGRRVYMPILESRRLYLIDDVRIAPYVNFGGMHADFALVRPCSTCNRLAADHIHIRASDDHYTKGTPEQRREWFLGALARVVLKAPQCTFCVAVDEAATCPTCHRGWER